MPMQKRATSPSAVSARLHRAGFTTVATRKLEGIRVGRGVLGTVHVEVDHDLQRSETVVADLLEEEFKTWAGYTYRRTPGNHFYVQKMDA
jgi:hypothetical protein